MPYIQGNDCQIRCKQKFKLLGRVIFNDIIESSIFPLVCFVFELIGLTQTLVKCLQAEKFIVFFEAHVTINQENLKKIAIW